MRKNIKFFVLKLFFLSLIFTSNANSKSPPPGTVTSADASKINVLLMLGEGMHWDTIGGSFYSNGGREAMSCSIQFDYQREHHQSRHMLFHNNHVFMSSRQHKWPDWFESVGGTPGSNSSWGWNNGPRKHFEPENEKYLWKGFRGITKHKIGDECEVDKTWAYDGQFSGYDVLKNRSEKNSQEMFRALNPKESDRDTDNHGAICYGIYQAATTTYNIYKVKTKNKNRFFIVHDRGMICEINPDTGEVTPIARTDGRAQGLRNWSISRLVNPNYQTSQQGRDDFALQGEDNIFQDFHNGRLRSGWFTFEDNNKKTFDRQKIIDFSNYDGSYSSLKWIECETPREMMNRIGETKFYDFFGKKRVSIPPSSQEYDINGGFRTLFGLTRYNPAFTFSNDGKYLWGISFVYNPSNESERSAFVIKKLKLADNGCIDKVGWDVISTKVDLHNKEKPLGSAWQRLRGQNWQVDNASIREHPTDPRTFYFTAFGWAEKAVYDKRIPLPKDPYRAYLYKVTFNDDYSQIVSSKKVMYKGGWGDLHNPNSNLGFRIEMNVMTRPARIKILGINPDKNEMYLISDSGDQTNSGYSVFVVDSNTLAFKRVFGGTKTEDGNNDQEGIALEAMLPVLSDPSITSQINFGLGLHGRQGSTNRYVNGQQSGSIEYGLPRRGLLQKWYGDLTTGYAKPCVTKACLKVRIHDKGAEQIKKIFEDKINFKNDPDGTNYDYNDPMTGTGYLGIPYWDTNSIPRNHLTYDTTNTWGLQLAYDYLTHPEYSVVDPKVPCASTYVVYLLPGGGGIGEALRNGEDAKLFQEKNIKSYFFVYGDLPPENTIKGSWDANIKDYRYHNMLGSPHRRYIDDHARYSGTEKGIYIDGVTQLKSSFQNLMLTIIEDAKKVSFSAPSVINETKDKNSAYQAKLKFVSKQQWQGELISRKLTEDGKIDKNAKPNWEASKLILDPKSRKLWSEIPGTSYLDDYNNFNDSNSLNINSLFELTGNKVADYHSQTAGQLNTQRCKSASGVMDGNTDDVKGLINFIRGTDYFDYDADCDLFEKLENPLADIYHSEMVAVGPPRLATPSSSKNTDAYFKTLKNYNSFAKANSSRKKVLYVGANNGILHAFDANTGQELWGFVPPLLAGNLPLMINTDLNTSKEGGSNAIYGVDGSPVVSNLFIQSPLRLAGSKQWRTILMIPYGRGGAGFSVLDVTNPDKPVHFYSIYNDKDNKKVHVLIARTNVKSYDYGSVPSEYDYTKLGQTWSSPRITRIPNSGAGDTVIDDDLNVAIMGGGYDDTDEATGSNLTIVNLDNLGKINKVIPLNNITNNNITNSAPSTPLVLTPDTVGDSNIYRGALVYLNDLEGKITKFNLTNMEKDKDGNSIEMYDSTQIFSVDANDKNGRYMYHGMDATIGDQTNNLWLFTGTGDYKKINARDNSENLLLGVKDRYFPNFQKVKPSNRSDLFKCSNASSIWYEGQCQYKPEDEGWYINLPKNLKVSAEPTVFDGRVYFPTYQPGGCQPGKGTICPVNDECGANNLNDLKNANTNLNSSVDHDFKRRCLYIGEGVLSKIIVTSSKLYANIAGETTEEGEDLVVLDFPPVDFQILRKSWRENF